MIENNSLIQISGFAVMSSQFDIEFVFSQRQVFLEEGSRRCKKLVPRKANCDTFFIEHHHRKSMNTVFILKVSTYGLEQKV